MRQFSAGYQWLSAGRKRAFGGAGRPFPARKSQASFVFRTPRKIPRRRRLNGERSIDCVPPQRRTRSGLHLQPAHEIPLAEGNAVGAQDVVGGGRAEIKWAARTR